MFVLHGILKKGAVFIEGSILDRSKLKEIFGGCDCIVHIAAWHGIHETRGEKNSYDFFDLNALAVELFAQRPGRVIPFVAPAPLQLRHD
jgi:hypothetical protein